MSLDFSLSRMQKVEVFDINITHNLSVMAAEAGVYDELWCGGGRTARDILPTLETGLTKLRDNPDHFKRFDASNGWGTYSDFVRFVEDVIQACHEFPDAEIWVSE